MSTAVILTVVAAVADGLVGGTFFAFSTFVMRGLARPEPSVGVAAMQGINVAAPTPPFMALLFGGPLVGIAAAIAARGSADVHGGWCLVGALASAVPAVMTIAFHVPRNVALDRLEARAPSTADAWATYLRVWTAGNHLRTLGATAAAVAFTVALVA